MSNVKLALNQVAISLLSVFATGITVVSIAPDAQALGFVNVPADGTFEKLQPVSPGIYGLEARGGVSGPADWEIGVGTQTSHSGTFSQSEFAWGDDNSLFDFHMSWMPNSEVSVTIGDTTTSWQADWGVGNAIEILAKRSAYFEVTEVDSTSLTDSVGSIGGNSFESLLIAGDSLLDGWTMKGKIGMTGGGRSRNAVLITAGTFTPSQSEEPEPVPEPASILGLVMFAALGGSSLLKRPSEHS
jgi:hypothetical protein